MKKGDKALLDLGKRVHAELPDCVDEVAVYGVGFRGGHILTDFGNACHAGLMDLFHVTDQYPLVISNKVQVEFAKNGQNLDEAAFAPWEYGKVYYDYLFNRSPYAQCFVTKDPETIFEDGITVRTDKASNLVVAACINTRHTWEWYQISISFARMVAMGIDEHLAFIASFLIVVEDDDSFYVRKRYSHVGLYANTMGKTAIQNFIAGHIGGGSIEPFDTNGNCNVDTYSEIKTYQGIPYMWGPFEESRLCFTKGRADIKPQEDPFGLIKKVGVIDNRMTTKEEVEKAFKEVLK